MLARRAGQPVVSSGTDATFRAVLTIPVDAPAGPEVVWVAGVPAPGAAFSVPVGSVDVAPPPTPPVAGTAGLAAPAEASGAGTVAAAATSGAPAAAATSGAPAAAPTSSTTTAAAPATAPPVPASGSQPANPPVGVVATAVAGGVELRWRAPAGPRATEYYLYRGTAPGQESGAAVATSQTHYLNAAVLPGITYYYVVLAMASGGISAPSTEASSTALGAPTESSAPGTAHRPAAPAAPVPTVAAPSAMPGPGAPLDLSARPGPGGVTLHWVAPAGAPVTEYYLYRSTTEGTEQGAALGTKATTYLDRSVLPGVAYHYIVLAMTAAGLSAPSAQAVS